MKKFPNRWIFIARENLQIGYATYRCHCICCMEEWHEILKDSFNETLKCPFCGRAAGVKDFEVLKSDIDSGDDISV